MRHINNGLRLESMGEIHAARESTESFEHDIDMEVTGKIAEMSDFGLSQAFNDLRNHPKPMLDIYEPDAHKLLVCLSGVMLTGDNVVLNAFASTMIREYYHPAKTT